MGPPPWPEHRQKTQNPVPLHTGSFLLLLVLHVDDGGAAAAASPLALPGRAGLVPLAGPGFL